MYGDPGLWAELMRRVVELTVTFLRVQAEAGAGALQLFDSWVGALPEAAYRRHVMPHSAAVLAGVADLGVPRIHFGVGTGELLAAMGEAGAEVVGVDFRVPLDEAARRVGPHRSVQGNLDPALLLAPWDVVAGAGAGDARGRPRGPRPRGQPRARRAARDRPRRADPGRRPRARGARRPLSGYASPS